MSYIYAELNAAGAPIRIFRYTRQAMQNPAWDAGRVQLLAYRYAVEKIRLQIFLRDEYACVHCGGMVTWESGEMHERQPRGQIRQIENGEYQGGEISIENSETRCHECHTGRGGAHDRHPMWTQLS